MRLKCDDGIVREFRIPHCDGERGIAGEWEAMCLECSECFGYHDTRILKPIFKAHTCKVKEGS